MPGGSCITATFPQSVSRSHTHPRAHTQSYAHYSASGAFHWHPLAVRASEEWYNPALLLLLLLPLQTHTCACHQPNSYVSEAVAFHRHFSPHTILQRRCFTQCFCVCVCVCAFVRGWCAVFNAGICWTLGVDQGGVQAGYFVFVYDKSIADCPGVWQVWIFEQKVCAWLKGDGTVKSDKTR